MRLKAKIIITDRGQQRRMMEITESKNDGTLYIKNNSGKQVGLPPDNKLLKEERYSIHPSHNSALYSTIVNHRNFIDNTNSPPNFHYTNAIKLKTGFTPIIHIRYPDFSTEKYDVAILKEGESIINLLDIDLSMYTIYLSLHVGHPETAFDLPTDNDLIKHEIITTEFKIVILITLGQHPAIPYSHQFNYLSHGAMFGKNYEPLPQHCQYTTVESCINTHLSFIDSLYSDYLISSEHFKQYLMNEGRQFYSLNPYKYYTTIMYKGYLIIQE